MPREAEKEWTELHHSHHSEQPAEGPRVSSPPKKRAVPMVIKAKVPQAAPTASTTNYQSQPPTNTYVEAPNHLLKVGLGWFFVLDFHNFL